VAKDPDERDRVRLRESDPSSVSSPQRHIRVQPIAYREAITVGSFLVDEVLDFAPGHLTLVSGGSACRALTSPLIPLTPAPRRAPGEGLGLQVCECDRKNIMDDKHFLAVGILGPAKWQQDFRGSNLFSGREQMI